MLFVLTRLGWGPRKMSVSPLAGIPAPSQLRILFQLAFAPPLPDQLKMAARLSKKPGSQANTNIAVTASRLANRGDREEWGVSILVIFIFSVLKLGTTSHFTQESDQTQDRIITRISCVRILGLSEIVVVVGCLVACSLQIWGVMEAIGEI